MNINYVKNDHDYNSAGELNDWDIQHIETCGFSDVWYWYAYGSYEGSGELLARTTEGKWDLFSLNHCSCYGPTEDIRAKGEYETLEDLEKSCSEGYLNEIGMLIHEAKEHEKNCNR